MNVALCRRHLLANCKRFGLKSAKDTFHFSFMKMKTTAWADKRVSKDFVVGVSVDCESVQRGVYVLDRFKRSHIDELEWP